MRPHPVVVPSLAGGWLELTRFNQDPDEIKTFATIDAAEFFGRYPEEGDFCGGVTLHLPDDAVGWPVLWDRETQLRCVYFFDTPDRVTGGFPFAHSFVSPDGVLAIDSVVDRPPGWRAGASSVATLTVRVERARQRGSLSGELVLPTGTCKSVMWALVDLFPSATQDDIDPS